VRLEHLEVVPELRVDRGVDPDGDLGRTTLRARGRARVAVRAAARLDVAAAFEGPSLAADGLPVTRALAVARDGRAALGSACGVADPFAEAFAADAGRCRLARAAAGADAVPLRVEGFSGRAPFGGARPFAATVAA